MATSAALSEQLALTDGVSVLEAAREELCGHAGQLRRMAVELDHRFVDARDMVLRCSGRVLVSGIGKSGLVARKIAATLACTGTPAMFLHPGEAAHGDLGVVTSEDVVLLVSHSGETTEVLWLLPHFERLGVPLIALTGGPDSSLARAADIVLEVSVEEPVPRVPIASPLVALALGDGLALAVMRARGLTEADVAQLHPGSPAGRLPPIGDGGL